jgi:hypothetical protein
MMRATLPPCTATADGQERDERTVTHLDWI